MWKRGPEKGGQVQVIGLTERLLNEGMQKGELNLLIRQLTRRFGPLDAATLQHLQQADSEDLERWADNILDANSLDEVFASR